jgi:hypothetical protein
VVGTISAVVKVSTPDLLKNVFSDKEGKEERKEIEVNNTERTNQSWDKKARAGCSKKGPGWGLNPVST